MEQRLHALQSPLLHAWSSLHSADIESFTVLQKRLVMHASKTGTPAGSLAHATAWNWMHAGMRSAQRSLPHEILHSGSALPWSTHSQVSIRLFSGSNSQCRMFARGQCTSRSLTVYLGIVLPGRRAGRKSTLRIHICRVPGRGLVRYMLIIFINLDLCRRRGSKLSHSHSPRFHSRASCPRHHWAQRSMA